MSAITDERVESWLPFVQQCVVEVVIFAAFVVPGVHSLHWVGL